MTKTYEHIEDPELRARLLADDAAEDRGMHPDDRETCYTHETWSGKCPDDGWHTDPLGTIRY